MLLWLTSQSALEWSLLKRQNQRIYRFFQDYLPPHLLKEALAQPEENLLLPQQRRVTILFADISGFTAMTEQLPTEEAAKLTRHILSLLTQAVYAHDGTLDKYMGDALMAFWNAPLHQTDHAKLAVDAALSMRDNIRQLNEIRATYDLVPIHVRIGINSGDVLVGDLGTQWRHAYTVLGDAVNVAQRLMMASTQLGVDIALGEHTAEGLDNSEEAGEMHLDGRIRLERVFVIPVTVNKGGLRYSS
jgi:adenylate cyclase